jgi:hypothetical protein
MTLLSLYKLKMDDTILIVGYLISIAITAFIIYVLYTWVDSMEKDGCDCSNLWHKDYVKFGLMFLLAYNILIMCIIKTNPKVSFLNIFKVIGLFITIAYWAIVLDYVIKLKENACGCSEDWKREFAYIYSIVYFIVLLFTALMAITTIFIMGVNIRKHTLKK